MLFCRLLPARFQRALIPALIIASFALIAGCGGGGGGGDGASAGQTGVDLGSATNIMSKDSFSFTTARNAPLPAEQDAILILMGADRLELYALNGPMPAWLSATFDYAVATPSLTVRVNTTDLTPGRYTASLRVVAIDEYTVGESILGHQDITISYQVTNLSLSQSMLRFRIVEEGGHLPSAEQVTLYGDDINWQAASDVNWLDVSPTSGTSVSVNITVALNVEALNLAAGIHTGVLSISAGGSVSTIDVTLQIDPLRISAIHNGMALTDLPSGHRLTNSTQIIDSAGGVVNWAASTDAAWLHVDPADGVAGDTLSVTADAGLSNGLYFGTVTLTPQNMANPVPDETIRVALYVSDQDPDPITTLDRTTMSPIVGLSADRTVADPLRPYFYTYEWVGTDYRIGRYHIYTGESLPMFDPEIGNNRIIKSMAISSDGSRLFIVHSDQYDETDQGIVTMNLDTGSIESSISISAQPNVTQCEHTCTPEDFNRVVYVRQNGHEVLITNMLDVINPQTGEKLLKFEPTSASVRFYDFNRLFVRASPDGKILYLQGRDGDSIYNDNRLVHFSLTLSSIDGEAPIVEDLGSTMVSLDSIQNQLVINRGGDRVCSLGAVIRCYDATLTSDVLLTPSVPNGLSIESGAFNFENDLYVGYDTYPYSNEDDIVVYDSLLSQTDGMNLYMYLDKLEMSGDGRRLVVIHGQGLRLSFIDVY